MENAATQSLPSPARRSVLARWWWLGILLVAALGLAAANLASTGKSTTPLGNLVAVERGPLTISVASSGSIRSGSAIVIKNQVEGDSTILWIIEEGTQVQKGDKLMELDSSTLDDERLEEEIEVETSRASFVNAQQMLEIARKQGQANIEAAAVAYRLALLDLEKYAGMDAREYEKLHAAGVTPQKAFEGSLLAELNDLAGQVAMDEEHRNRFQALLEQIDGAYKQEMRQALNGIILADAELRRAEDYYKDSEELFAQNFIASSELLADRLEYQRRALELEVAVGELELLANFTYRRTIEELCSAVNQAGFELEKAKHEAEANVVDAEATQHAARERLVRDEQHLNEIREQIAACTVRAPQAGMVVYGTTGEDDDDQEPLAEGVDVRERQDLFFLPTADKLVADIKIHESVLKKVSLGMPVHVTTDALPGRAFRGRVERIAVLPDAQSRWLNPDMKVYNTVVEIIGDHGELRTGMSCRAEIIVAEFPDTLFVPIQAVVQVARQPTVYVPTPEGELAPRAIQVGLDDNRMVQVAAGLTEGQLVSLTPPLQEGQTSLAERRREEMDEEGLADEDRDPFAAEARHGEPDAAEEGLDLAAEPGT